MNMYKNLISKIIDQKVEQNNQIRIQQANQKRVENAKFNPNNLLVGYISKVVDDRDNKLSRLIANSPRLFIRIKDDMLQDIETGKNYLLVLSNQHPNKNIPCVMERDLEPFIATCLDALVEKNIKYDNVLTKNQAKDILNRQTKLNSLSF